MKGGARVLEEEEKEEEMEEEQLASYESTSKFQSVVKFFRCFHTSRKCYRICFKREESRI